MNKKYIVRLSDEERRELVEVINKLKGTSQKVKRAQILLKCQRAVKMDHEWAVENRPC